MHLNPIQEYPFLGMIIAILITLVVSFILIKLFHYIINKAGKKLDIDITLEYLLKDLFKYSIYIIAFILILEIVGIDITAIIVSLGIVGISIGFAARDIISNFMSGLFILSDKSVKVGEVIEVLDIKGRVTKIGFRTTTLITADNKVITVPNAVLSKNPYINYTYLDEHRIDLEILLPYKTNLNEFKKEFLTVTNSLSWILENSKAKIIVKKLVDNGIEVKLSVWACDYSKIEENRLKLANKVKNLINNPK